MDNNPDERLETDLDQGQVSPNERERHLHQQEKRLLQIKYLEKENENLTLENSDLQTTLRINKEIIAEFMKSDDPDVMFAIDKAREESEDLRRQCESLREERDRLNSQGLLHQQVVLNSKEKDLEITEIFREQIDELKENLERKEYLLQLSEQRSAAFEKLLLNLSGRDAEVHAKIAAQNIILKDRKISNVASENVQLREQNEFLVEQNAQMREQLENVLAQIQQK